MAGAVSSCRTTASASDSAKYASGLFSARTDRLTAFSRGLILLFQQAVVRPTAHRGSAERDVTAKFVVQSGPECRDFVGLVLGDIRASGIVVVPSVIKSQGQRDDF